MKQIVVALGLLFSLSLVAADAADTPVETFYQHVDVQRNPQFAVQGMNVNQQIHYQIQSSFEVYAADDRENRKVTQTVSDARLVEADPLSRAALAQSLAEMKGQQFVYQINKFSEVVSMEGHQDKTKAVHVQQPNKKGVLVSTVIDEDGWKELAQLTLFQPPRDRRSGRSFVRKTTHDWGALGSWYGKTNFSGRTVGRDVRRFDYQHQLEYIAPNKDAAKPNELPFKIENAAFRIYAAKGEIQYSDAHNRVTRVREIFRAKGTVAAKMLGVPSTVDIAETQVFTITVTGPRLLKIGDPDSSGGRKVNVKTSEAEASRSQQASKVTADAGAR